MDARQGGNLARLCVLKRVKPFAIVRIFITVRHIKEEEDHRYFDVRGNHLMIKLAHFHSIHAAAIV